MLEVKLVPNRGPSESCSHTLSHHLFCRISRRDPEIPRKKGRCWPRGLLSRRVPVLGGWAASTCCAWKDLGNIRGRSQNITRIQSPPPPPPLHPDPFFVAGQAPGTSTAQAEEPAHQAPPSKGSTYLVRTSRPSLGRSSLSDRSPPPPPSFQGCVGIFFHVHGASLASKHYKHHLMFPFLIKITKSLLYVFTGRTVCYVRHPQLFWFPPQQHL